MNDGPLFSEENLAALLSHLAEGSFAHQLVSSASTAAARSEVETGLAKVVEDRVAAVREALDAAA
jgi:hypothetical protein